MKHAGLLTVAFAALVLQSASPPVLPFAAKPDFLLAAALWAMCRLDGPAAVVWAGAIGLLSDCLLPAPLGTTMFCTTAAALALQIAVRKRRGSSPSIRVVLAVPLAFLVSLSSSAIRTLTDGSVFDAAQVVPSASWAAGGAVLVFLATEALWRVMKRPLPHPPDRRMARR